MKKLSLLISIYFFSLSAYSQNYINFSKREIINALSFKGDNYELKLTSDGSQFLISQDRVLNTLKSYYFDESNLCYLYVNSHFDIEYSLLVELLDKNYTRSGSYWYSSDSKINIKYNSEYSCYQVIFVRK